MSSDARTTRFNRAYFRRMENICCDVTYCIAGIAGKQWTIRGYPFVPPPGAKTDGCVHICPDGDERGWPIHLPDVLRVVPLTETEGERKHE